MVGRTGPSCRSNPASQWLSLRLDPFRRSIPSKPRSGTWQVMFTNGEDLSAAEIRMNSWASVRRYAEFIFLVVLVGFFGWWAYSLWNSSGESAVRSCVGSVHSQLANDEPAGPNESANWRIWSEREVSDFLSRYPDQLDCCSTRDELGELRIRSRRNGATMEFHL